MKKIFLTGANGFFGTRFMKFYENKYEILGVDKNNLDINNLALMTYGQTAIMSKRNLFYKNPTLALLGYKLYKVDTEKSSNLIFISKDDLNLNDTVHHIHLHNNVYFVKK